MPMMSYRLLVALTFATALAAAATSAGAQTDEREDCRLDIAMARRLIDTVASHENSMPRHDTPALCRLLRGSLGQMTWVREAMQRCLVGDARTEDVGQLNVSIEGVRRILSEHCRGR